MKCLLTGGSSLLGRALIQTKPKDAEVESTWYTNYVGLPMSQLNITDRSQVHYLFDRFQPEIVIHCAANGNVDFAEKNYSEAHLVNCVGTENILRSARSYRSKVVYISTNAVFDGRKSPYSEKSERHPINAYGSIKRQAEDKVMAYDDWVIIRPFLLYGWPWPGGRQNWVTTIINRLSTGQPMKLVNDVIWQPTYVIDCAKAIWSVLQSKCEIYHVAADDRVNLYEFGLKVAEAFDLDSTRLLPVGSDSFPGMAKRPPDTTYVLGKIKAMGIELSNIESGLTRMKEESNL